MRADICSPLSSARSLGAESFRWQRSLIRASAVLLGALFLSGGSFVNAATVISQSANTTIVQGVSFAALEFENPLAGTETVQGYEMLEWRDADYSPGPPRWYDDWTVSNPNEIDGNPNEIWMRRQGHWATTSTTIPSRVVSIHLTGDGNDGVAQVVVDGAEVARLEMNTQGGVDRVIIIVKGLANTTHQIRVNALGVGPSGMGDDVAINGAAALRKPVKFKWLQPPEPGQADNVFLGWNEFSVLGDRQIAADDWVCETMDPVTDVHWWGSYIGWNKAEPPPVKPIGFQISIWTDVPAGQDKPYSHPGQVVWQIFCENFNQTFAGWDYDPREQTFDAAFRYDQLLTEAEYFYQEQPGQIFWISIAAVYPPGEKPEYPWGWKTRPRRESPAPDDAVRIFTPTTPKIGDVWQSGEPIFWPTEVESWDLAFELTTKRHGLKWHQPPSVNLPGLHAHDYVDITGGYHYNTLADDFICPGGLISDLEWWGNYEVDPFGNEKRGQGINYFHLSLHQGGPAGMPSPTPGPPIWQMNVPFLFVNETDTGMINLEGCKVYKYRFDLPELIPQLEGNQYWFDIRTVSNTPMAPAIWRWQEANRSPTPAVMPAVDSDTGGPWKTIVWAGQPPRYSDMAFDITSTEPQPGPEIKWSQPPEPYQPPNVFNGWDEPSVFGGPQIVADDWVCMSRMPVTDIHWWGSFKGWSRTQPPLLPDGFHFAIWTDVPQGSGTVPYSHPGKVVWNAICEEYEWEFVGWDIDPRDPAALPDACFLFTQDLRSDQFFYQEDLERIFWLSIAAIYQDNPPEEYIWGWKTRPRQTTFPPDDAVRIFDPTRPLVGQDYKLGEPIFWPTPNESWDTAFGLTTIKLGILQVEMNKTIRDHFWYPRVGNRPNEMLSILVGADATEAVQWSSLTLQASGTGNDATDISAVQVYRDVNNNGQVDAGDVLIGSGMYPVDNGTLTIVIGPAPVVIPAGQQISVLVAYLMNPIPLTPPLRDYRFTATGATGIGVMSGASVPVQGLPLTSARKVRAPGPHKIGAAKLLNPLGSQVLLEDKVVTANYFNQFGILYVSEPDRAAGIGVIPPADATGMGSLAVGSRISILGTTTYFGAENTEVLLDADLILQTGLSAQPLLPLRMNNRATAGGRFGHQPAVVDQADLTGAGGHIVSQQTNNVGSLIRTWGTVTGVDTGQNLIWMDDGSRLLDGGMLPGGARSRGIAVLLPSGYSPMPSVGTFLQVTGTIWAIPGGTPGDIYPARLLVPRDSSDITVETATPGN